jgi:zinc protease
LDQIFGELPAVPLKQSENTELTNAGKTYIYKMNIPQTIIEIAQPGVSRSDKDYYAAQLLNHILGGGGFGSRLMEEVREKRGLTYGIYTYFNEYESAKSFHVTTSTVNESIKDVLGLILQEWEKMKTTPVSIESLRSARAYLNGALPLSLTSGESIAETLLSLQLDNLPITYLDDRKALLDAVTPKDIQATAQRLLDSSKFTTILVGNPQSIENAEILKTIPNAE